MSGNLLSHIQTPDDLRKLDIGQLPQLAQELRDFIIDVVSVKEGHLGARFQKLFLARLIPIEAIELWEQSSILKPRL